MLIHGSPVADERSQQGSFLPRAKPVQRGVAASVVDRRARFDPLHTDDLKCEIEHQPRRVREEPGAPRGRIHEEPELSAKEPRLHLA